MRKRMQTIDQQTFERLQCRRCGECCRSIMFVSDSRGDELDEEGRRGWWHYRGPLGWLEVFAHFSATDYAFTSFSPEWFGQLEPYIDGEGQWRYRCGYLRQEGTMAACMIYAYRPLICANFPYGKPSVTYSGCVWNVEVATD